MLPQSISDSTGFDEPPSSSSLHPPKRTSSDSTSSTICRRCLIAFIPCTRTKVKLSDRTSTSSSPATPPSAVAKPPSTIISRYFSRGSTLNSNSDLSRTNSAQKASLPAGFCWSNSGRVDDTPAGGGSARKNGQETCSISMDSQGNTDSVGLGAPLLESAAGVERCARAVGGVKLAALDVIAMLDHKEVYRSMWNNVPVVVKALPLAPADKVDRQSVVRQMASLLAVKHENIVSIFEFEIQDGVGPLIAPNDVLLCSSSSSTVPSQNLPSQTMTLATTSPTNSTNMPSSSLPSHSMTLTPTTPTTSSTIPSSTLPSPTTNQAPQSTTTSAVSTANNSATAIQPVPPSSAGTTATLASPPPTSLRNSSSCSVPYNNTPLVSEPGQTSREPVTVRHELVMIQEHCAGTTLQCALDTRNFFRVSGGALKHRVLQTALDVAQGMMVLHAANLVHGALCPHNIFLVPTPDRPTQPLFTKPTTGYVTKVGDAGLRLITRCGSHRPATKGLCRHYLAPEACSEWRRTQASDVYAFGALLWDLNHGTFLQHPVITTDNLHPALQPNNQCRHSLCQVARRCLASDPSRRPSFSSLVSELHSMFQLLLQSLEEEQEAQRSAMSLVGDVTAGTSGRGNCDEDSSDSDNDEPAGSELMGGLIIVGNLKKGLKKSSSLETKYRHHRHRRAHTTTVLEVATESSNVSSKEAAMPALLVAAMATATASNEKEVELGAVSAPLLNRVSGSSSPQPNLTRSSVPDVQEVSLRLSEIVPSFPELSQLSPQLPFSPPKSGSQSSSQAPVSAASGNNISLVDAANAALKDERRPIDPNSPHFLSSDATAGPNSGEKSGSLPSPMASFQSWARPSIATMSGNCSVLSLGGMSDQGTAGYSSGGARRGSVSGYLQDSECDSPQSRQSSTAFNVGSLSSWNKQGGFGAMGGDSGESVSWSKSGSYHVGSLGSWVTHQKGEADGTSSASGRGSRAGGSGVMGAPAGSGGPGSPQASQNRRAGTMSMEGSAVKLGMRPNLSMEGNRVKLMARPSDGVSDPSLYQLPLVLKWGTSRDISSVMEEGESSAASTPERCESSGPKQGTLAKARAQMVSRYAAAAAATVEEGVMQGRWSVEPPPEPSDCDGGGAHNDQTGL